MNSIKMSAAAKISAIGICYLIGGVVFAIPCAVLVALDFCKVIKLDF